MIDHHDPRLTAFVLEELDAEEEAQIRRQLQKYPELAQAVEEIRQTMSELSDAFAAQPRIGLRTDQRESLLATANSGTGSRTSGRHAAFLVRHWAWAATAVAACIFGVLAVLQNSDVGEQEVALQQEIAPPSVRADPEKSALDGEDESSTDSMSESSISSAEPQSVIEDRLAEQRQHPPIDDRVADERRPLSERPTTTFSVYDATDKDATDEDATDEDATDEDAIEDGDASTPDFDTLIDAITSNVAPDKWEEVGGKGSIEPFEINMSLRISNTQQAHDEADEVDVRVEGQALDEVLQDASGGYLGPVRVELLEGTDVFVVRGAARDVDRVQSIIHDIERLSDAEVTEAPAEVGTESMLARQGQAVAAEPDGAERPIPSERTPAGHELLSVVVAADSPVVDVVTPGDKVDAAILLPKDDNGETETHDRFSIVQNATVFDVQQDNQAPIDGKTISLLVSPEERERLDLAKQLAPIQLAINKPGEDSNSDAVVTSVEEITRRIEGELRKKRQREAKVARTWRRVRAVPNTSRLMVGDKDELNMNGMQVNVQIDGFRARVLVDFFYYNDRDQQLEGTFKIRLPDDASLYYFAFGQSAYELTPEGELTKEEFFEQRSRVQPVSLRVDDIQRERGGAWQNVKEARVVPREKAAFAYGQTVRRRVDPALVEWTGAGVFNARVFPLMPRKLHRIVVGYDVNLTDTNNGWVYELDVPEQVAECKVDIHVRQVAGSSGSLTSDTLASEIATKQGRHYHIDQPTQGEPIRLVMNRTDHLFLRSRDENEGDFFGSRFTLDLPREEIANSSRGVFLLDTSLSSRPDKFNVWLDLMRATLDNNRDSLREFAVLFFNVENHFWQEQYVENTPENVRQLIVDCQQLVLEGATDLYAATQSLAEADWITASSPNLFLLSDGAANWGETNLRLVHQVIDANDLGSMFAYQTGLSGTAIANLRFLAGATGGAVFSVAHEDEVEKASTAHRQRPWRLMGISGVGVSDLLTAGRLQWVYPGQSMTLVGRVTAEIDEIGQIELQFERGDQSRTVKIRPDAVLNSNLASRLYGQVAVGQLESLGQAIFDVTAAYARHFRITGETCSLLMLESEEDYQRFNIRPQEDLFVIKSKTADSLVASVLEERAAELADPKSQLLAWLSRLENMPGMKFKMPTALKLTLDDIQISAISHPLTCEISRRDQLSKEYLNQLSAEQLDYDAVMKEASRRGETSGDDAIKVLSSLVEQNPGDLVLARDVAFSAMELSRPAAAFHLLKRIAQSRPYDPSVYTAIGQCLTQLGEADVAILFYELAVGAKFQNRSEDFRRIAGTEYAYLLREIVAGRKKSDIRAYASARLNSLSETLGITKSADLLITMMWNTDQTDVDLHVIDPAGEECFYSHPKTKSGGQLTRDITDGFGPEMFSIRKATQGDYEVWVKYFSTNPNRAGMRSKVYLTIYRDFGAGEESMIRKIINVTKPGHKELVETLRIK